MKASQNFKRSLECVRKRRLLPRGTLATMLGHYSWGALFWSISGPVFGWILGSVWGPKMAPKLVQNWFKNDQTLSHFFYSFFCNFGSVLEPKSSQKGGKSGSGRWPRGGLGGSRRVFAHMHLDSIFTLFLEHQAS